MLTREQIECVQDLQREVVGAWGGQVVVQELTAADRVEFEDELRDATGERRVPKDVMLRLLVRSLVDEAGLPLFSGAEGIRALGRKSVKELFPLFEVALRLSAMSPAAQDEQKKSSDPEPIAGSPTSSPGNSATPT